MAWELAPSLTALFAEVNAEWPHRDKTLDGTIGDAAHAARKSEHNPNRDPHDDVPDGMVTAADIDKDGIDVARVLDKLIGEHRVWYVIHDRHIWSRTYGWKKQDYRGPNPHTGHIHVSLVQAKYACEDTSPWGIHQAAPAPKETPYQRVARIAHQRLLKIRRLRRRLNRG